MTRPDVTVQELPASQQAFLRRIDTDLAIARAATLADAHIPERDQPCAQCQVPRADHPAGDGVTKCPGDFPAPLDSPDARERFRGEHGNGDGDW